MSPGARALRLAVCGFTLGAASIGWCSDRALDRLETLGRTLEGQSAWQATFNQEFISVGMIEGETATGRVWLAWPDRALFHTGNPPVRLMGLDGRIVRLVDRDDGTCDEHRLSDREWERVPLAAVLDPRGAVEHFSVLENGDRGLILVPNEPGGVDRVEVELGGDGMPLEVTIRDPQGAINRLRFDGWAASDPPPGGDWLPPAPAGVECVGDSEAAD